MNTKHFLISFSALGALSSFGVAYSTVSASAPVTAAVSPSSVSAAAETIGMGGVAAYSGWFFGLGLSHQYTKGEVQLSDNLDTVTLTLPGLHSHSLLKSNVGRVGGSVIGGYGDFVTGNCYLGAEVNVDITGSNKSESEEFIRTDGSGFDASYGKTTIKTRGIVPTIAARIGWYVPTLDSLVYARVGLTFLNNKLENAKMPGCSFGSQKVSPVVGLGIETTYFGKYGVRLEGDYRFAADKKGKVSINEGNIDLADYGYDGNLKNKVRGYAVRVVCVYHF